MLHRQSASIKPFYAQTVHRAKCSIYNLMYNYYETYSIKQVMVHTHHIETECAEFHGSSSFGIVIKDHVQ